VVDMTRLVRIKKETTFGTYVAPDTVYKDVDSTKFEASNDIQEPTGINRGKTRFSPGRFVSDSGGFSDVIDARLFGQMLFGALGGSSIDVDIPVSGANEHVFTPSQNLASYSIDIGLDEYGHRRIAGSIVDRLALTCEAGSIAGVEYDMPYSYDEFSSTELTQTYWGIDATYHHGVVLGFHEAQLAFGTESEDIGSHNVRHATRFSCEIANNSSPDYVLGQRRLYKIREGGRDVTGGSDFLFEDDVGATYDAEDEVEKFYGAVDAATPQQYLDANSISFKLTSAKTFTATQAHEMTLFMPRTIYESGPVNLDGRGPIVQTVAYRAYESLITPVVTNLYTGTHTVPAQYEIIGVITNDIATDYNTY
jgi:hypothetical protein